VPAAAFISLPVLFLRWFKDGIGYAYSSEIDDRLRTDLVNVLAPISRGHNDSDFRLSLADGRILVGNKILDPLPLDPQSSHRGAFVVRVAICPSTISVRDEKKVQQQLTQMPLPEQAGKNPSLLVRLPLPSPLPVIAIPRSSQLTLGLWQAVGLLMGVDVLLYASEMFTLGLVVRIAAIACIALLVLRWRMRIPSMEEISTIEWQWYEDAEPERDAIIRIAEAATIITPEGREMKGVAGQAVQTCGVTRSAHSEVNYHLVDVRSDLIILMGVEIVADAEERNRTSFARSYVYENEEWRLKYAQWTIVNKSASTLMAITEKRLLAK
jgi:hypothetical protein